MHLTRRDYAVVGTLVIALVVLGGVLSLRPRTIPQIAIADATQSPTMPPPVVYREGVVGTAESITPLSARNRAERSLVGLVFSGLTRMGPRNTLEPDLASSWKLSDDGKTWTFHIRDDAVWQDGEPVTSADVLYTVGALKDPEASGGRSGSWAEVETAAVDDKTVTFRLTTPVGGFLAATTQPLLPAHLLGDVPYADIATSEFAKAPIGSGPYGLAELDVTKAVLVPAGELLPPIETPAPVIAASPDSLATPIPSPSSPGLTPFIERIELSFFPDDAAVAAALEDGSIDAAAGLAPDQAATISAMPGVDRIRYPTTTLSTVLLNLRPNHPELRDVRVRRALLAGIDREGLVRDALGGDGSVADSLVPPSSWAYDGEAAGAVAYDKAAAAKLLRAAGWTRIDGAWAAPRAKAPYDLQLLSVPATANPRLASIATAVRDAWTELGFKVTLVEKPAVELAAALRGGTFTASVLDIMMGLEPDLYPLLASSQVRGAGSNLAGLQDAKLDELLEDARKPAAQPERVGAWKALLAGIGARIPMLPLAWGEESMFVDGVEGVTPTLIGDTGDRYWDVLAWRLAADR
ncbi:MAG TPA: ABC transporter substrate-binding protein [Candidatus Limnocylindrales bacterium]|nr:ABC transporter substrate-binding protein [Candidatus Limnocylindrales bacterium]